LKTCCGSSGSPTEVALYTDALAIFDHLASEYRSVSAIGRSLGAGVASFLAAERPLQKLVLVTPFDSVVEVAREQFSLFPVDLLVKDRFDAASHASRISMPTLVIIAAADEVIPRARSDALVSALGAAALSVQVIDSATHNTIDHHHQYLDSISQFMSGAAP
jgi:esterase/lipase